MRICSKCQKTFNDRKKSSMCPDCRSAMGRRSRRKGYTDEKRFEKYFQKEMERFGLPYKILRSPRSGGIRNFSCSDFFFKFLPSDSWLSKLHFEKKDRANWDIIGWIKEAEEKEKDSGEIRKPIIISRKPNDTEDYISMKKEVFVEILLQLEMLTQELKNDWKK